MLSNGPTFNAISHKQHTQIVNHKPPFLRRILYFTHLHKNLISTEYTRYTEAEDYSLVRDLLYNLTFVHPLNAVKRVKVLV
jgi:hypothetical protein